MLDRESILPLSLGGVAALVIHALLVPAVLDHMFANADPVAPRPDIRIESIVAPKQIQLGQTARIRFSVANRGEAAVVVTPQWIDTVYFSADDVLSEDDKPFLFSTGPRSLQGDLFPIDAEPLSYEFQVPVSSLSEGRHYLLFVADSDEAIDEDAEDGESNNLVAVSIDVVGEPKPAPDLRIPDANVPKRIAVGDNLTVDFTVINTGKVNTPADPWQDAVYLSFDDRLSDDDTLVATAKNAWPLKREAGYPADITGKVDLPPGVGGRMYVIIRADDSESVAESDEFNNTVAKPIDVIGLPVVQSIDGRPDLQVLALDIPGEAIEGERLFVRYTVGNRGKGVTVPSKWKDRVYLSPDPRLDDYDTLLSERDRTQPLRTNEHYEESVVQTIELPDDVDGRMFVIVKTDAVGEVEESREDNNIRVQPIMIDRIRFGKEDSPEKVTVAWIAHDDFKKLIARETDTLQPALQSKAEPVPNAPIVRNPSPPVPPQPKPNPATSQVAIVQPNPTGAQPQPLSATDPNTPSRQIAAESLVKRTKDPIRQAKADSPLNKPDLPTLQLPATGPSKPGVATTQIPSDTPKPQVGQPTRQLDSKLPEPIAPTLDPLGPRTSRDRNDVESLIPSVAPVKTDTNPTKQVEAKGPLDSPKPPTNQVPVVGPKNPDGKPTTLPEVKTPEPQKNGQPADAKPVKGDVVPDPRPSPPSPQPGKRPKKADDQKATPPRPQVKPATPTAAPKSESDVPPTVLTERQLQMTPGSVITGPGLEIVASVPQITDVSWLISGRTARNPIAKITFDRTGKVRSVYLKQSTGHVNLDSPIKAAFYRFKARGKRLERIRDSFEVEIKLLLKGEPKKEKQEEGKR